jgi:hypothetical protein
MNNKPNNNLNDFLNKNKQSLEDDFEKDAFAGFETFDNKEDALNLKETLDKKINTTLFSEKKRYFDGFSSHNKTVWYAAASLFLVIGLTVLFILNNGDSIVKTNDVSLVETKKEVTETKSETESILNVPANSATSTALNQDVKLEEKNKSNLNKVTDTKNITENTLQEEVQPSDELIAADKSNKQELKKSEKFDLDNLASAKKGNTQSTGAASNSAEDANVNDKVTTTKTSPGTVGGVTAREAKKEGQKEDEKPSFEAVVTNKNSSTTKSLSKDTDDAESDSKKDEGFATSTNSNKKAVKSKERKKNRSEANQPVSMAEEQAKGPEYKNNETPKSSVEANTTNNQCYYSGGETVFTKDIAVKLIAKNVNKKFDAILFINEKKQVEKVNFTNTYDLNADDRKTIEGELKNLSKFNFFINPTTKTLYEFKLEYRP